MHTLQLNRHPTDGSDHRAPACLGGMGSEHRVHPELLQHLVEARGIHLPQHLFHRRVQGLGQRVGSLVALAQGAHALVLFGQVREVEVARERAGDLLGAFDRPRRHQVFGPASIRGRVARGDDEPA